MCRAEVYKQIFNRFINQLCLLSCYLVGIFSGFLSFEVAELFYGSPLCLNEEHHAHTGNADLAEPKSTSHLTATERQHEIFEILIFSGIWGLK